MRLLHGIKAKVNLLPLNAAPGIPFERPSDERVNRFAEILADHHVTVSVRKLARPRHPGGVRAADHRVDADDAGQRLAEMIGTVDSRQSSVDSHSP